MADPQLCQGENCGLSEGNTYLYTAPLYCALLGKVHSRQLGNVQLRVMGAGDLHAEYFHGQWGPLTPQLL